jgi:hypothetical protein
MRRLSIWRRLSTGRAAPDRGRSNKVGKRFGAFLVLLLLGSEAMHGYAQSKTVRIAIPTVDIVTPRSKPTFDLVPEPKVQISADHVFDFSFIEKAVL